MASSSTPVVGTPMGVLSLLSKLNQDDPDLRFMALNDVYQIFQTAPTQFFAVEPNACLKINDAIIKALNDTRGDVQNMAIKCLEPYVKKVGESVLSPLLEKLSALQMKDEMDNAIPGLALRAIVVSLPRPTSGVSVSTHGAMAYAAISKALIPRLVGAYVVTRHFKPTAQLPKLGPGLLSMEPRTIIDSNILDVLVEVARCFGPLLQPEELKALSDTSLAIIEHPRANSIFRKKAVTAISAVSVYFSDALLSDLMSKVMERLGDVHLDNPRRKAYITILGSLARSIPRKFGPHLHALAQFVFSTIGDFNPQAGIDDSQDFEERDPEEDEVREAALVAIESFVACCSEDMTEYMDESLEAGLRFLKFDPNLVDYDDGNDDAEDFNADDDDEFESDDEFDDEDDNAWKLRRCAAKLLHAMVQMRSQDLLEAGALYDRIAPELLNRFKEKDQSVLLEVLDALSLLVRKTGQLAAGPSFATSLAGGDITKIPVSRKRRRGGSDTTMADSPMPSSKGGASPEPGSTHTAPLVGLTKIGPELVQKSCDLTKRGSMATKEASLLLLKDLISVQRGGLGSEFKHVLDIATAAVNTSGIEKGSSLQATALLLLKVIAETHSGKALQPYSNQTLPAIESAVTDRNTKVAIQALRTLEQFVKALLPLDSASALVTSEQLDKLYDVVFTQINATGVDTDVKRQALHCLGMVLGHASATSAPLSPQKHSQGLVLLSDRLKNEVMRLSAVDAIEELAKLAASSEAFPPQWLDTVSLELGAQFRKASRALRASSLSALQALVSNPAIRTLYGNNPAVVGQLSEALIPLLKPTDLHVLTLALHILARFVRVDGETVVGTKSFIPEFCSLLYSQQHMVGPALSALLDLSKSIAEARVGDSLFQTILQQVGTHGETLVVGKVLANLIVFSGTNPDEGLRPFISELETSQADGSRRLALVILGESGFLLGAKSPLKPSSFTPYFSVRGEKVPLTAAIAMGRAGAKHVSEFLPVILDGMKEGSSYLALHSIREILSHPGTESDILPYADTLWEKLTTASAVEDNRAVGAECIGRLAVLDSKTYLPQLQAFLENPVANIRGMVISALRFTFADSDETYDDTLRQMVIDMLITMLNEENLENRRLAFTTLTSAVKNKPDLVMQCLEQILPLVMRETKVNPKLIREVKMGPFTHKVDDGMEIRKSAYETLYELLYSSRVSTAGVTENSSGSNTLPSTQTSLLLKYTSILLPTLLDGLKDAHDIRLLCFLMLSKLLTLSPDTVHAHLNDLAAASTLIMSQKLKENPVKQEVERVEEERRATARLGYEISRLWPAEVAGMSVVIGREGKDGLGGGRDEDPVALYKGPDEGGWRAYWAWVRRHWGSVLKAVEDERGDRDR
ncbi:cullin-associated NEDD8-dissociated protein-like protein [Eremomyces bilateralis CBS 781.70]|uniref:Cullin-associated NEDD8-dissociated protein-like protein n=1 Tax=Eremomyces bilateralis CBS 781.70 TaxID=1392243 RepID=A0A6G1GAA1_9PEZI|nr:cullin-associated NEDD8-dissociated protein-like protein [Eremomyces bilateralis CBS 781.70]KAF1814932.1 cullin-associated NEDD8-dissociated protein-like protein [Eremomyces bilateralis CBS 781.70]